MSDDQIGTSAGAEDRAQSREELIQLLVKNEDWAGLDAMTTHLSASDEDGTHDQASALALQLLASLTAAKTDAARARLRRAGAARASGAAARRA